LRGVTLSHTNAPTMTPSVGPARSIPARPQSADAAWMIGAASAWPINVTVTSPSGERRVYIKDGMLARGHRDGAPTSLVLGHSLARKIFVEADTAAGIQAFLAGEIKVEGDLAKLVAMQLEEPSAKQKALAHEIAAITR
jgi:putative sterol carrier protein